MPGSYTRILYNTYSRMPAAPALVLFDIDGTLVRRERTESERDIANYTVIEHDGVIVGCAALYPLAGKAAELAALAVRPEYRSRGYGEKLLEHGDLPAALATGAASAPRKTSGTDTSGRL